ncbi:iron-sulfur cluster assembly accessory protein [Coleofasciculus sp. FACHB-1120]|uniref:iron-sulfur cluster assembly accessory protein n=1 Tax=Coleofasciculus sp. FACHB-1120 TaxID=2692783 RepID=UPI001685DAC8|nr:iron-sulfur cluster assembly accessory protein [Coleofasciculus sp. FACHB-1120]
MNLTQAAASEIKRLQSKRQNANAQFFRLAVQLGGCSGISYAFGFDAAVKPDDRLYECNSIAVLVDAQSLAYLNGLTLDYSEDLMGGGFRFYNPNAKESCGCGNSFSINEPLANSATPEASSPDPLN